MAIGSFTTAIPFGAQLFKGVCIKEMALLQGLLRTVPVNILGTVKDNIIDHLSLYTVEVYIVPSFIIWSDSGRSSVAHN